MKIATIGLAHHNTSDSFVTPMSFMKDDSLQDVDTIVWNVEALATELEDEIEQHEPKILSVKGSETLLAMSRHWRQEFKDLLAKGGTIIAFLPPPIDIGIHTLEEVMQYNLLESLHNVDINSSSTITNSLICNSGEPFRTLFKDITPLLTPSGVLDKYPGTAILHNDEGGVLASFYAQVPGRIILLPSLNDEAWDNSELRNLFYESIEHCIMRFGQTTGISNAKWINEYVMDNEKNLFEKHSEYVRELGILQKKIQEIEETVNYHDFFKQILAGIGPGTYIAVAQAFRSKGAFVQSDWVHSNLILVELKDSYLAVQIRLPGEVIDNDYIKTIHNSKKRVGSYFNKEVTVLVVDCSKNEVPLPMRNSTLKNEAKLQDEGFLYIESSAFYGWYLDQSSQKIESLLNSLRNERQTYTENLKNSVNNSLHISQSPIIKYLAKPGPDTLPQSDIFER